MSNNNKFLENLQNQKRSIILNQNGEKNRVMKYVGGDNIVYKNIFVQNQNQNSYFGHIYEHNDTMNFNSNNLQMGGNLNVLGSSTFASNVSIAGNFMLMGSFYGTTTIFNNVVGEDLFITGDATFNGSIYVNNTSIFNNNLLTSGLFVSNSATVKSNLNVSSLTVSNNANIHSLDASFIYINGEPIGTGGSSLTVTSFNESISVSGDITISNNAYIYEDLTTSGLHVNNNAIIHSLDASFIYINGEPIGTGGSSLTVTSFNESISVSGDITISNNAYVYNGLVVNGNTTFSNLFVDNSVVIGKPQSISFGYIGDIQTFIVPNGITQIYVELYGSAGQNREGSGLRGLGGKSSGILNVNSNDTLYIYVGGIYGFNGGGIGGVGYNNIGYGGDATDIRLNGTGLLDRIIVAGGGGGAGLNSNGGNGGGLIGLNGLGDNNSGGGGGTQSSGGNGGTGLDSGFNGSLGYGGAGYGGGGGGGYYGGGGGGSYWSGGGGGGSSYGDPILVSNFLTKYAVNDGLGYVLLSYTNNSVGLTVKSNVVISNNLSTNELSVSNNILLGNPNNLSFTSSVFTYIGNVHEFIVPEGITELQVELYGAGVEGNVTTYGGRASGTLNVNPGQTLYLFVGGNGGWNGGGQDAYNRIWAGDGTDIRIGGISLNNRVIVAGGAGTVGSNGTAGGNGGGLTGGDASGDPTYIGRGGNQTLGGGGGLGGSSGDFGVGGNGATTIGGSNSYGGGGGGGWYGGGGGGADGSFYGAGGGGGSSYGDPIYVSNFTTESGVNSGQGYIIISYFTGSPVSGNLFVYNNSTFNNEVSASGLYVSNNVNIDGTLNVSGNTTLNDNVSVSGLYVSNNVSISGILNISGNTNFDNDIYLNNKTIFTNDFCLSGDNLLHTSASDIPISNYLRIKIGSTFYKISLLEDPDT